MSLITKAFGIDKFIEKKTNEIISKSFDFTTAGAIRGTKNKYAEAKGNSPVFSGVYSEELYIYGCVYLISNTIASIPLQIYKDDTKKDKIDKHDFYKLLKKPNFKDSEYDVKENVSANLELTGNAFLLLDGKEKSSNIPTSIFPLISSSVVIEKNTSATRISSIKDFITGYKYGNISYTVEDILHERKFNPTDEYYGLSPLQAAGLTIDVVQESKRRNYNIFKNGVGGTDSFETDQPYNAVVYNRLKADVNEKYQKTENAHVPHILFNGLKYKNSGIALRDLEYVTGLKLSREELCGFIYQVPIILLGVLENSSYNNISEATKIFYNICIKPRLAKNREIYQKLLDLWGDEYYIDFDLSNIDALKEDLTDKIKNAQALFGMGVPLDQIIEALQLPLDASKIPNSNIGYLPFNLTEVGKPKPVAVIPDATQQTEPAKHIKQIQWTEQMKEAKWKRFISFTDKYEALFKTKLVNYFEEQESEVIKNINQYKSFEYTKVHSDNGIVLAQNVYVITAEHKAINIEGILFDYDDQTKKLLKINNPVLKEALKESGQSEFDLLNVGISFDVTNPRVSKWLAAYGLNEAKQINQTIKDKLKESLIEGIKAGEGMPKLQDRIKEIYSGYKDIKGYETERIARTEVIGASNQGALESYKQANVEKKGWLRTYDDRTRDSHIEMGNKYADGIPIDEEFINDETGGHGQAPGQMGTADDDINCRCSLYGITK